jgi:hypothetical protein
MESRRELHEIIKKEGAIEVLEEICICFDCARTFQDNTDDRVQAVKNLEIAMEDIKDNFNRKPHEKGAACRRRRGCGA